MPEGVETTVPDPAAPPCTVSLCVLGGGANFAVMVLLPFMVTLQVNGLSVTSSSQLVQVTVPPLAGGVAVSSTTAPVLKLFEQVPDRLTCPDANVTVHVMPPRFETSVPPAVLPAPESVRVLFPGAAFAPLTWGSVISVGCSPQACRIKTKPASERARATPIRCA